MENKDLFTYIKIIIDAILKSKAILFLYHKFVIIIDTLLGLVGRVFANDPDDVGSIPGRVIRKTLKMVLDTSLFNTQRYKMRIKGKVRQSRERSSALPYNLV